MLATLTQLIELTEEIKRLSQQKDWEGVARLQPQREKLARWAANQPLPDNPAEQAQISTLINQINALDQHVIAQLSQQQQQLAASLGEVELGHKMQRAYQRQQKD